MWHQNSLGLNNEPIRFWWSKVKVTLTPHPFHSWECDISVKPGGYFITWCTKVKVNVTTQNTFWAITKEFTANYDKISHTSNRIK